MKKYVNYIILLFFVVFLYSCTIKVGDSGNNNNNNNNGNQPLAPVNPIPSDGATGVSLTPQLCWVSSDSNTCNLRYDVYMDINNPPNSFLMTAYNRNCNIPSQLSNNTTYYWKVKAIDNNSNNATESNIWRFTTGSGLPTNGLLAYYPFNGNANDESGNGHNGMVVGATLTMDRFNNTDKAYSFNGISSYIIVPNSYSLQPTSGITLSAWVMFYSINNTSSILSKGSDTIAGYYSLRLNSTNQTIDFKINFSDNTPDPRKTVSTNTNPQTYTWYNIIGTFGSNTMKIYLNGQLENSLYMSGTMGSNTLQMMIGSSFEGYFLNGAIDDIRIYNRALNDSEIQQLFHEGGWQEKNNKGGKKK